MDLVPKKCAIKTDGHFVFDHRPKIGPSVSNLSGFSGIQSDILRLNTEVQNVNSLEIQLKGLNATIQMFWKRSSEICNDVISAYHDRSLVLYHLERFDECIADATFIIEKRPFYSNAFIIRSRALLRENRVYEACDDILRACLLEKFAENEINAMLAIIVKTIGEYEVITGFFGSLIPLNIRLPLIRKTERLNGDDHGGKAFEAYKKPFKFPASQWAETLQLWKATNNYITTTFAEQFDDEHPIGFRLAINALHRNQYSLIVPACETEIMLNGEYAIESRLLRAQMHHLLLPFGPETKQILWKDLIELKSILAASPPPDDALIFDTKLLMCRIHFSLTLARCGTDTSTKSNVYTIFARETSMERKGIAHFWQGYDMCATFHLPDISNGIALLRRSLTLMGREFFVGHFYQIVFFLTSEQNLPAKAIEEYVLRLGQLHTCFPREIQPVKLLINYYIQNKEYKLAANYIETLAKLTERSSNGPDPTSELEIIIGYLKSVIVDDPEEYAAYNALIVIYSEQTHEYGKCLEVMTKAMAEIHDRRLYRQLFQRRQKLLFSIAATDFWPEL